MKIVLGILIYIALTTIIYSVVAVGARYDNELEKEFNSIKGDK